jgi:hypothetical protein
LRPWALLCSYFYSKIRIKTKAQRPRAKDNNKNKKGVIFFVLQKKLGKIRIQTKAQRPRAKDNNKNKNKKK